MKGDNVMKILNYFYLVHNQINFLFISIETISYYIIRIKQTFNFLQVAKTTTNCL